jgi:UDPglucose 6-dehydrogenase
VYTAKVAALGLSFKPHSDDVRDSPTLDVAVQMRGLGADAVATDPQCIENSRSRHPQLSYATSIEVTLRDADVLVTEWAEFKQINPVWAAMLVRVPLIIDARSNLDAGACVPRDVVTWGWGDHDS